MSTAYTHPTRSKSWADTPTIAPSPTGSARTAAVDAALNTNTLLLKASGKLQGQATLNEVKLLRLLARKSLHIRTAIAMVNSMFEPIAAFVSIAGAVPVWDCGVPAIACPTCGATSAIRLGALGSSAYAVAVTAAALRQRATRNGGLPVGSSRRFSEQTSSSTH